MPRRGYRSFKSRAALTVWTGSQHAAQGVTRQPTARARRRARGRRGRSPTTPSSRGGAPGRHDTGGRFARSSESRQVGRSTSAPCTAKLVVERDYQEMKQEVGLDHFALAVAGRAAAIAGDNVPGRCEGLGAVSPGAGGVGRGKRSRRRARAGPPRAGQFRRPLVSDRDARRRRPMGGAARAEPSRSGVPEHRLRRPVARDLAEAARGRKLVLLVRCDPVLRASGGRAIVSVSVPCPERPEWPARKGTSGSAAAGRPTCLRSHRPR